jgi:hypothetical protein
MNAKKQYSFAELTKLLVATGNADDAAKYSVEIVNLDEENPDLKCDNFQNLPIEVPFGATGQLLFGRIPIICGGWGNECNCQAFQNGSWFLARYPTNCRTRAASTILTNSEGKEVLLIAGGYDKDYKDLRSVETFDGNDWKSQEIRKIPIFTYEHCIVKINSSTLLSIGGQNGKNVLSSTFFYNAQYNKWTPGPVLTNSRSALSCGILKRKNPDSNQMQKIVVAAGGTNCNCRPSVELLYLNSDDSPHGGWEKGPELPTPGVTFH